MADRAEPVMRAMRAALTMRRDRLLVAVVDLKWDELRGARTAAELLIEEVDKEMDRRRRPDAAANAR